MIDMEKSKDIYGRKTIMDKNRDKKSPQEVEKARNREKMIELTRNYIANIGEMGITDVIITAINREDISTQINVINVAHDGMLCLLQNQLWENWSKFRLQYYMEQQKIRMEAQAEGKAAVEKVQEKYGKKIPESYPPIYNNVEEPQNDTKSEPNFTHENLKKISDGGKLSDQLPKYEQKPKSSIILPKDNID